MKLVAYCRISTDSQADNTSLTDQREKLEAYCKALGHELVAVYEEIGSGTKADRPKFQEALKALDNADGIIATKLDRIARNTRNLLNLVEDILIPNNKTLILLDMSVDTSQPNGRAFLGMMGVMAQLERDLIHERVQGGRKAKADKGGYSYGSPKFGEKSIEGELVINEKEQEIIEIIRKHRKSGKSYQKVADYLNTQGIPTKQGKNIKWSSTQVKRICDRLKSS